MKVDILAFGAHPDDTELCCAGTLAALVKQGKKTAVVDLTQGQMGTRGNPELRLKEAAKAASILGLSARDNLGMKDSEIKNTRENQLKIIRKVRFYKPHICFITAPTDRHPDHGDATRLLIDAIFYSGLIKIETKDISGNTQQPHRPAHILHYMQDQPFEPDFVFDITNTMNIKEEAIKAFASQFHVDDPGDEPETYISSINYFESLRAWAMHFGHLAGFKYAEAFKYYQKPAPLRTMNVFFETNPIR
ncbi:MAG: bacillithiol biosynthesis deacetylase BshB1 [Balneolaceae bacterium]